MFHCSNQILDPRFQCEDFLPRGQRRLNLAGAVQTAGTGLESGGRGGRRSRAALCSPGLGSGSPGSPGSSHCRGQQGCPGNWQSDRQNSADFSPPPGDDHSLLLLLLVLFDRCCSPRCQGYLDRCFLLLCLLIIVESLSAWYHYSSSPKLLLIRWISWLTRPATYFRVETVRAACHSSSSARPSLLSRFIFSVKWVSVLHDPASCKNSL